jgi:Collagen triple helix repeat (20 copies)
MNSSQLTAIKNFCVYACSNGGCKDCTGGGGTQGPVGPTGPSGGPLGPQGAQGPTGLAGTAGVQGAQGPTGFAGTAGVQGAQGPTGFAGTAGVQGAQGPTGFAGTAGVQGAQGPTGPEGKINTTVQVATAEPTGFANRLQTDISFTDLSSSPATFSIWPVAGSFDVWVAGTKFTKTALESVSLPVGASGLFYIFYDTSGNLGVQTSFFIWDQQAPTAYVYFNTAVPEQFMLFDERHGITMDWATHEYLHRTRGAQIANGFGIFGIPSPTTGGIDADAQFSLNDGTFFDEDLQVDITNSGSGIWNQQLVSPARMPTVYLNSAGLWRKSPVSDFCFTVGANSRPNYNSITAGVGTVIESASNRYVMQWIVATNMAYTPVIAIMGQGEYSNLSQAQAVVWGDLYLTGFPIVEMRPLYRIIFDVNSTYANSVNCRIADVQDIRAFSQLTNGGIPAVIGATGPQGPQGPQGPTQQYIQGPNIPMPSGGAPLGDVDTTIQSFYVVDGSGGGSITGLTDGITGKRAFLINNTDGLLTLLDNAGSLDPNNGFYFGGSSDYVMTSGAGVSFIYADGLTISGVGGKSRWCRV